MAACSTAVADAADDVDNVWCETGVDAGALAAALASALAERDILVSIPSKLCILKPTTMSHGTHLTRLGRYKSCTPVDMVLHVQRGQMDRQTPGGGGGGFREGGGGGQGSWGVREMICCAAAAVETSARPHMCSWALGLTLKRILRLTLRYKLA